MTDYDSNGSGTGRVYVPFGDKPWQEIPLEAAAEFLKTFRSRDPKRFGQYLADAMTSDVTGE